MDRGRAFANSILSVFLLCGIATSARAAEITDGGTYEGDSLRIISDSDDIVSERLPFVSNGKPNRLFKESIEKEINVKFAKKWNNEYSIEVLTLTFKKRPKEPRSDKDNIQAPAPEGSLDFTIAMFKNGPDLTFTKIPSPRDSGEAEPIDFMKLLRGLTLSALDHQSELKSKEDFIKAISEFDKHVGKVLDDLNPMDPKAKSLKKFRTQLDDPEKGLLVKAKAYPTNGGDLFRTYLKLISAYQNDFAEAFGFEIYQPKK